MGTTRKLLGRLRADLAAFLRPRDIGRRAAEELAGNILPFWLRHARAPKTGGFVPELDRNRKVNRRKPRGALLASRILWTFAAAQRRSPDPDYEAMARYAYRDLVEHFLDFEDGGLFWSIKPAGGSPHAGHKRIYGQAFGIYGLSEFARMSGEARPLELAIDIYRRIEAHARDAARGGYASILDREWQPTGEAEDGAKSMNTMLHLMEAYTNLYRAWPDAQLGRDLHALATALLDHGLMAGGHLCMLFDADWVPLSRNRSPGHAIEFSWLITETCAALGDAALMARAREVSVTMARTVLGDLAPDGALFYEADANGAVIDGRRSWWVHSEAVVGFLNAFELSGDRAFRDAATRVWSLIERSFIDRRRGGWIPSRHADGAEDEAANRIDLWTCPYHNARACMEIAERMRRLQAGAVSPSA